MNLASYLILAAVLTALALAVRRTTHDRRHPEDASSCHSTCGSCSLHGACSKRTPPISRKR